MYFMTVIANLSCIYLESRMQNALKMFVGKETYLLT